LRALDELHTNKRTFGKQAEQGIARLLETLESTRVHQPIHLIRLHETVLFLRAFPQSARIARLADGILMSFAERLRSVNLDAFDDPQISGIAGTAISTNFSYEFASSLVARYDSAVSVDWQNYARPDRLGPVLAQFVPAARDLYSVEPHVDWRAWFQSSGHSLKWLLARIEPLVYELLEIPIRWQISAAASRSGLRLVRDQPFYRRGPFLTRSDFSLEAEFAAPPVRTPRLSAPIGNLVLNAIIDASAARYRELHGFQYPDRKNIFHADLGRGVDLYFFGAAEDHRLAAREYHCGMFFTNGVPTGYVETLSRGGDMEVGFNLYYSFREGETAWVFARLLKVLREQIGATRFTIDPYQLGHENEEGIESGAFWFYRKLGFAPDDASIARLVAREERKISADPNYRTSRTVLRRLAAAPLVYRLPTPKR
jgi:hypothetical protein